MVFLFCSITVKKGLPVFSVTCACLPLCKEFNAFYEAQCCLSSLAWRQCCCGKGAQAGKPDLPVCCIFYSLMQLYYCLSRSRWETLVFKKLHVNLGFFLGLQICFVIHLDKLNFHMVWYSGSFSSFRVLYYDAGGQHLFSLHLFISGRKDYLASSGFIIVKFCVWEMFSYSWSWRLVTTNIWVLHLLWEII